MGWFSGLLFIVFQDDIFSNDSSPGNLDHISEIIKIVAYCQITNKMYKLKKNTKNVISVAEYNFLLEITNL